MKRKYRLGANNSNFWFVQRALSQATECRSVYFLSPSVQSQAHSSAPLCQPVHKAQCVWTPQVQDFQKAQRVFETGWLLSLAGQFHRQEVSEVCRTSCLAICHQQQCAPGSGKKCCLYSGGNLPRGSRSASGMLTVVLFCWQLSLGCGWEKKESNRTLSR